MRNEKRIAQHRAIVKPAVEVMGVDEAFKSYLEDAGGPDADWW